MSIPNLRMMHWGVASPQVYDVIGGALGSQIGIDIATLDGDAINTLHRPHNRAVEFKNKWYCLGRISTNAVRVCEEDQGGAGTWGTVYETAVAAGSAGSSHSGLYIVHDGTDQLLCFFIKQVSVANLVIYTSNTGAPASWSLVSLGLGADLNNLYGHTLVHQNALWTTVNTTKVIKIDPVSGAATIYTATGTARASCLVVFRDTLYMVIASGNTLLLREFSGSSFVANTTVLDVGATFTTGNSGLMTAWADDTNIHIIGIGGYASGTSSTGIGSRKFTLTPSGSVFTVVDKTTPVIPSAFRPHRAGKSSDQWFAFISTDTDPTAPEVYLFFADNDSVAAGSWTVYQYTDDATLLTTVAAGPSVTFAPPYTLLGSGEHIDKGGGNRAEIETSAAASGTFELSIRIYGLLTGQVLRIYYSTDQHPPNNLATLSSVSGGAGTPVLDGGLTKITSVDGDDGVTILTVKWNMSADGVASPDSVTLSANITVA